MDKAAFEDIFNRHADAVHTYIRKRLGEVEADDVLQEVFLRLWDKRHSITIHTSPRNYLYTLVQNCITDHLRRSARRKGSSLDVELYDREEQRPRPDEQVQYKQVYRLWKDATEQLPGQMRRIYVMKNEQHLSVKEIASELQLSEQTVKNQLNTAGQRILKRMTKLLTLIFF